MQVELFVVLILHMLFKRIIVDTLKQWFTVFEYTFPMVVTMSPFDMVIQVLLRFFNYTTMTCEGGEFCSTFPV